jgi:hypothetical protein
MLSENQTDFFIFSDDQFSQDLKNLLSCQMCNKLTIDAKQCKQCEYIFCDQCLEGTLMLSGCPLGCPKSINSDECNRLSEPNQTIRRLCYFAKMACKKCLQVFSYKDFVTHSNCKGEDDKTSEIHMIDILIRKNQQLKIEMESLLSKNKLEFASPLYRAKTIDLKFESKNNSNINSEYSEVKTKYNDLQQNYISLQINFQNLLRQFNFEVKKNKSCNKNCSSSNPNSINLKIQEYYDCPHIEFTGPRYDVPPGFSYEAERYSTYNCDHVRSNFICIFDCCEEAYPCAKCHEEDCDERPKLEEIYCKRCFEFYDAWDTVECDECDAEFGLKVLR